MPSYNTATAALALGVTAKWLDNLLSHHQIFGVSQAKQGIPRKLSTEAIVRIAIATTLNHKAGIPISSALSIADDLVQAPNGRIPYDHHLTLALDLPTLSASLAERLGSAVELAPTPRRGRPKRG